MVFSTQFYANNEKRRNNVMCKYIEESSYFQSEKSKIFIDKDKKKGKPKARKKERTNATQAHRIDLTYRFFPLVVFFDEFYLATLKQT